MKLPPQAQSRVNDLALKAHQSGEPVSQGSLLATAKELQVDVKDLRAALATQLRALDEGTAAAEQAGASSRALRDSMGHGGTFQGQGAANAASTPALQGHNLQVPGEQPMGQQQMNMQAHAELDEAIGFRDEQVGRLLKQWDTDAPENVSDLDASDQAFDKFMQAEATFAGNLEARGGSLMPLVYANEAKALVEQRTGDLRKCADEGFFDYSTSADIPDTASQMEMNMLAYEAADKADDKMNKLVGQLKDQLSYDPESIAELDEAQAAFGEFREAQATLAGNVEARGGSLFGAVYASAAESLTNQRIDQLQARLGTLDDVGGAKDGIWSPGSTNTSESFLERPGVEDSNDTWRAMTATRGETYDIRMEGRAVDGDLLYELARYGKDEGKRGLAAELAGLGVIDSKAFQQISNNSNFHGFDGSLQERTAFALAIATHGGQPTLDAYFKSVSWDQDAEKPDFNALQRLHETAGVTEPFADWSAGLMQQSESLLQAAEDKRLLTSNTVANAFAAQVGGDMPASLEGGVARAADRAAGRGRPARPRDAAHARARRGAGQHVLPSALRQLSGRRRGRARHGRRRRRRRRARRALEWPALRLLHEVRQLGRVAQVRAGPR
jgi:uncharacterized protein YecT (DUF1311 family)